MEWLQKRYLGVASPGFKPRSARRRSAQRRYSLFGVGTRESHSEKARGLQALLFERSLSDTLTYKTFFSCGSGDVEMTEAGAAPGEPVSNDNGSPSSSVARAQATGWSWRWQPYWTRWFKSRILRRRSPSSFSAQVASRIISTAKASKRVMVDVGTPLRRMQQQGPNRRRRDDDVPAAAATAAASDSARKQISKAAAAATAAAAVDSGSADSLGALSVVTAATTAEDDVNHSAAVAAVVGTPEVLIHVVYGRTGSCSVAETCCDGSGAGYNPAEPPAVAAVVAAAACGQTASDEQQQQQQQQQLADASARASEAAGSSSFSRRSRDVTNKSRMYSCSGRLSLSSSGSGGGSAVTAAAGPAACGIEAPQMMPLLRHLPPPPPLSSAHLIQQQRQMQIQVTACEAAAETEMTELKPMSPTAALALRIAKQQLRMHPFCPLLLPPSSPTPAAAAASPLPLSSAAPFAGGCLMALGQLVKPHPGKAHRGGEDACFMTSEGLGALGVADGVGGYSKYGINPGPYAKSLADQAELYIKMRYRQQREHDLGVQRGMSPSGSGGGRQQQTPRRRLDDCDDAAAAAPSSPRLLPSESPHGGGGGGLFADVAAAVAARAAAASGSSCSSAEGPNARYRVRAREVIDYAHRHTDLPGGSTFCVAVMQPGYRLEVANVGDSGIKVVRGGKVVFTTRRQAEAAADGGPARPFQLSSGFSETAADADVSEVQTQPGDVIIAGTDGLFDNLFDWQLLQITNTVLCPLRLDTLLPPPSSTAATTTAAAAAAAAANAGGCGGCFSPFPSPSAASYASLYSLPLSPSVAAAAETLTGMMMAGGRDGRGGGGHLEGGSSSAAAGGPLLSRRRLGGHRSVFNAAAAAAAAASSYCHRLAAALVEAAHDNAADCSRPTPWSQQQMAASPKYACWPWWRKVFAPLTGGKMDDITAVVAIVV